MVLAEGTSAPDFKLMGTDNGAHSLSDYRGKKVVLYFYPKDDTPGCTKEACSFRDSMESIKSDDTVVLGVSKDTVMSHIKFTNKYNLNFMLLADMTGKVHEEYGVVGKKSMWGKSFLGTVRSTFIIDRKGKIVKVFSPVNVDGHSDEVIEALRNVA
ncbi:MAG: thioredoxin-dependent thiol peroxidase [Candidatus Micrarchaeota archaeon]|nr:thioredoxin-dependent thiol peroxidase [Candidatus Micrarchaeota archaeon]MDE1846796.1 thioredoxin-dependent thiol peroxidase [Candidatus Micrarchaeota archaeon]